MRSFFEADPATGLRGSLFYRAYEEGGRAQRSLRLSIDSGWGRNLLALTAELAGALHARLRPPHVPTAEGEVDRRDTVRHVVARMKSLDDLKSMPEVGTPRAGRHKAENAPAWASSILEAFRRNRIRNLVFLPDTVMGRLLAAAEADPFFRLVAVHREEEAVGILTGLFLGGQRGAMLIQNTGLGNSLNALASLALAYKIAFPLVISLRGELGEFNPAQLVMGRAVRGCLEALGIQHFTLQRDDEVEVVMDGALKTCFTAQEPLGILLSAQMTGWKDEE